MSTKSQQSREERRAAIEREIEAITVDIERVRSLVNRELDPVNLGDPEREDHRRTTVLSRSHPIAELS